MVSVDSTGIEGLEQLRAQLEEIDNGLLEVLQRRVACCVRIAQCKREYDVPMMQTHRIDAAHRRARDFAVGNGLDPGFLRRLYDLVIEECCRVEDAVMDGDRAR